MPGLLDIIGQALSMPTALAQQKANLLQTQQQNQVGQSNLNYTRALNDRITWSMQHPGQTYPGPQAATQVPQSAPSGLLPQPQTTQSPSGPVTSTPLPDNQAQAAPSGGLLNGAIHSINAAQPGGGLLPPQGQQGQQPNWLAPPTAQAISSLPVGGFDPQLSALMAMHAGKSAADAQKETYAAQLTAAKQQYDPIVQSLAGIVQSDNPVRDIKANPMMLATWQHYAQARGLDPAGDLNATNARQVFGGLANQYRAQLGETSVAPPIPLRTVTLPDGRTAQINASSGQETILPQPETANFLTPHGIRMMPKTEGMRLGYTPYTPQTYINTGTVDPMAQMIADYKSPPLSGYALRSPQGQAIMAEVTRLNPNYDATQYGAKVKARDAFATGKQGDTVRSLSVATNHLNQLSDMVDALNNNNIRVFNRLGNAWNQETGSAAPTNFDTVKNVVADEVTKAILGYGGSQGDREKAAAVIDRANSPAQLKSAIAQYERLMGGQLDGLRRQYEHATGLKDFDSMLSPQAQAQVEANAPNTKASTGGLPAGWTVQEH